MYIEEEENLCGKKCCLCIRKKIMKMKIKTFIQALDPVFEISFTGSNPAFQISSTGSAKSLNASVKKSLKSIDQTVFALRAKHQGWGA